MEASNENNGISPATDDGEQVPAAGGGQGDFSLKPAGRKKAANKLVIIIVVGFLLAGVLLVSLMAFLVLRSPDGETVIDESQVKPAPLLQSGKSSDNSMNDAMGRISAENAVRAAPVNPDAVKATEPPAAAESQARTQGNDGGDTAESTEGQTADNPAQPAARYEESLFTPVSRFESSGMSSGGSGGGSGGATGGDDREAQLREFINQDPEKVARDLVNNSGGSSSSGGLTGGGGSLLDNLGGTQYAATRARLAPPNKFRLKKYTSFQCVAVYGIKTDYPGFTKCTLTMPLYSADGSVILARAGAELRGEQKVEIHAGQSSVFTTWTELETSVAGSTQSVLTSLNGLGTDAMGRSGTDAEIDNHWGMKIGGALLLSTFQDALGNYSKRLSGGGNGSNNYSNTENTTEDMASKVLDANINIAPTGYVKPGTVINVIVAQDIDFSSVYTTRN